MSGAAAGRGGTARAAPGRVHRRPHPAFTGVAEIILDRPEKRNALDGAMIAELTAAARALGEDPSLFAVVLRGAGGVFVGGADIGAMAGLDEAGARAFITALHEACAALRTLPVPVIAAIEGVALGAGLEIAAACDLRLADRRARFGMPEVRLGIPSVIEAALLPRLIGSGRARALVMLGEAVGAEEARAIGLIDRIAGEEGMEAELAAMIAALREADPAALRAQKALCRMWEERPLAEAVAASIGIFAEIYRTGAPAARMGAFLAARHAREGQG
jgi:enoyl-CoA hydratase